MSTWQISIDNGRGMCREDVTRREVGFPGATPDEALAEYRRQAGIDPATDENEYSIVKDLTDRDIREHLGHNGRECRVRIKRNGEVYRHGSPTPTDRSRDFWAYMGERDEIAHGISCSRGRRG